MRDLDRLAELVGIEPGYHDIAGNHIVTSDQTKQTILERLGFSVGTEGALHHNAVEFENRAWRRLAPACQVIPAEHQPAAIVLAVPTAAAERTVSWLLTLEDGETRRGHVTIADLPVVERHAIDDEVFERRRLDLPDVLPDGYHRLALSVDAPSPPPTDCRLIVAPKRCWGPDDVAAGERLWGISCQVYSLRSDTNWGVGTYRDLATLADAAAPHGADMLGINPLHALPPAVPEDASPYSPASRDFLNVLTIDVESLPELTECPEARTMAGELEFRQRLTAVRNAELIDYAAVAGLALPVLRTLFRHFRQHHIDTGSERGTRFRAFREAQGQPLQQLAVFMALQETLANGASGPTPWPDWPVAFRHPDSPAVHQFARDHAELVDFHAWLQWLADEQLAEAAAAAAKAGMRIGLYRDLAVGVGPASAAAWSAPETQVRGIAVGAPPDPFSPVGQNWGLSPFNPLTLRDTGYAAYIASLRANMRHAGALRIDHAMGLRRLFWVADGLAPSAGAYVSYPFEDMLRVLALESRRQRCIVIGEDLGTVPDGFRPAMAEAGILSYKVLLFERVGPHSLFRAPDDYDADALVTAGTHDLPPLAGYWVGRDIDWRHRLGLFPDEEAYAAQQLDRTSDRQRLIDALIHSGFWPSDRAADPETMAMDGDLMVAVYRFLSRTPCRLMTLALEDGLGQVEQMNLPGTVNEHPNWRRRLAMPIADLFEYELMAKLIEAVRLERTGHAGGAVRLA